MLNRLAMTKVPVPWGRRTLGPLAGGRERESRHALFWIPLDGLRPASPTGTKAQRDGPAALPLRMHRAARWISPLSGTAGAPTWHMWKVVRAMSVADRWSVELSVGEDDGDTHAQASLVLKDGRNLFGQGQARRNPADPTVTEIGEEIAVARALSDLAHKLLGTAATGVEAVTHERARLHM